MAEALINKLGVPLSDTVKIRVGAKMLTTRLKIRNHHLKTYMLSPQLAKALLLRRRKPMQIRYDIENEMIHIGPTIGILSNYLPSRATYNPKSLQAELIFLSNLSRSLPGQTYFFTPSSINWANKTVRGSVYHQISPDKGSWVSAVYTLPDVVYDRIGSRKIEAQAKIRHVKRNLMNFPYLKYFNPAFLNKWSVHQNLITNEMLMPYLPETHLLNRSNLEEMAARHKTLFLKPCNGSQGGGIIKVNVGENGKLRYTINIKGRYSGTADNPAEFMKKTHAARRRRPYIIQQGINLSFFQKSTFDIRIIFQKNHHGNWKITKQFVRLAPPGSSIANISRGGKVETSKRVLAILFKNNRKIIHAKNHELSELCELVAETLESSSQKLYGELGLDVGIDKGGKFWLIEVNSKPRKTTETVHSQGIVRNTFRRPLQYAIYLAGFKNRPK